MKQDLSEIMETLKKFTADRNWEQFQNPKDLSLSLCLEAAELLENFQWLSAEEATNKNIENIKEELADVFIYSIQLAMKLDVDIVDIIEQKITKNAEKYPVE